MAAVFFRDSLSSRCFVVPIISITLMVAPRNIHFFLQSLNSLVLFSTMELDFSKHLYWCKPLGGDITDIIFFFSLFWGLLISYLSMYYFYNHLENQTLENSKGKQASNKNIAKHTNSRFLILPCCWFSRCYCFWGPYQSSSLFHFQWYSFWYLILYFTAKTMGGLWNWWLFEGK